MKQKELNKKGFISHIKKCFAYAIAQNRGKSIELAKNVRCIPDHLYNRHENCDARWCKKLSSANSGLYKQKYTIKSDKLYEDLKEMFSVYADNAFKYCISASSQANEAFNNSVTRKFPKNKSFSTSISGDMRVHTAALVSNEKNVCFENVKQDLNLPIASHLIKNCEKLDKENNRMAEKAQTKEQKARRMELAINRESLRKRMERTEGVSYMSNIGFEIDRLDKVCTKETKELLEEKNCVVVVFDEETSGRRRSADILQLAAVANDDVLFSVYIKPTQDIEESATAVNRLTRRDEELYFNGNKLLTISMFDALIGFLEYLNKFKKKCLLVAHNASLDKFFLLREIFKYSLSDDFDKVIWGFCDTLKLFKQQFPDRKGTGMCTLTKLAEDFLKENSAITNFHDATYDVLVLKQLIEKKLNFNLLANNSISMSKSVRDFAQQVQIKSKINDLATFKSILSSYMIKKIASVNITYKQLQDMYEQTGEESLKYFLSKETNEKPFVTKDKKILNAIINHLKNV